VDSVAGLARFAAVAAPEGKRGAFERVPARGLAVIILTTDPKADAKAMADRIVDALLAAPATTTGGGR
jgi:hypothetical protein